ncbi:MAG TPA: CocE/NonD family hydrolase [Gemmataceae bacterium]|nr:CocE/NonD family hydrolase [Gemmataceae bacterium]
MRSAHNALLFLLLVPTLALAQKPEDEIKERYTKYEYRIPMRDGVKLFTAVYVPKDQSQKFPILMMRTPYSCAPYGIDRYPDHLGPSPYFWKEGYILVNQDVRGRWMSEGEYVNMRPHNAAKNGPKDIDEASDTFDTIEWLVQHVPNNNGRVGQWGISYPGFYTAAGMIDAHPALKASSPQAPINDWFMGDDWHHNGALMLPHCFNFMANFGKPRPEPEKKYSHMRFDHETPDGYQFFLNLGPLANADKKYFKGQVAFWNEVTQHPNYDEFWQARNLRPHLKNIRPAVMTVGGWFDAENLFGALETYRNVEKNSPDCRNTLVMGPWNHGGWSRGDGGDHLGDVRFNAKTSKFFQEKIELPFFEYHLKGKGDGKYPEAWVFETGTNVWRQYDAWPPKNAKSKTLYFQEAGKLSETPSASADEKHGFDEYISDPAKPVPYYERTAIGMAPEYMVGDQRQMGRRPDVLVYQTDVLTEDVTLVGPFQAKLHVSTSGTDSDWIVKLIDVYPDDLPESDPRGPNWGAYQQLIRGDVFRGRFRKSFEKPEAFVPNEPTSIQFTMEDICHTFRPGHRIMIQVQSTWFPLVDRNPQTFVENIAFANESDFQKATQRLYRTKTMPSGVQVLVMP